MVAVKTVNLTKKFDNLTAVNALNLQIEQGEIFGLVGPDGAGKTTILRLLTTVLKPTTGQGWVYDRDIIKESDALKEYIAYMPQHFGLYEDLTVIENMSFYADIYCIPSRQRAPKIENLLEFSNLKPFKKRLAKNLSGGMKQKLGLTCALIHGPLFQEDLLKLMWQGFYPKIHDKNLDSYKWCENYGELCLNETKSI